MNVANETWWKTERWVYGDQAWVKPVEIVKATDKRITLASGRTVAKSGFCGSYYPTREEAVSHVRETLDKKVAAASEAFRRETETKAVFEKWAMQAPEEGAPNANA